LGPSGAIVENALLELSMEGSYGIGENHDLGESVSLKIYPNPTKDMIFVELSSVTPQSFGLSVFDITGNLVLESVLSDTGEIKEPLNVGHLTPGLYLLRVSNSTGSYSQVKRFIVQ
jgi:hypothetical protein